MNVLLFGATGMVGQGALRECLSDDKVQRVISMVRTPSGLAHAKLREVAVKDFASLDEHAEHFAGIDACLFCLGISAAGMTEADYRRITYDYALAAAKQLLAHSPEGTFMYVSGSGTDSSGKGRWMWARVKGETENALLALSPRSYMFRPGYIQPVHGIRSKTPLYRAFYAMMGPMFPLWKWLVPRLVLTTEELGRAMLIVAKKGAPKRVLESADIAALAGASDKQLGAA
jgi:uncharacterized protein YbjT (DUF2867 family)